MYNDANQNKKIICGFYSIGRSNSLISYKARTTTTAKYQPIVPRSIKSNIKHIDRLNKRNKLKDELKMKKKKNKKRKKICNQLRHISPTH